MIRLFYKLLLIFFFLSGTVLSFSQDAQKLTLQIAVEQTLENNPKIKQLESKLKAKSQAWRTATGIHDPELIYMQEGINKNTTPAFEEQRIGISQSVDFPLTSVYRLKKIKREKEAIELQLEAAKRSVKEEVKKDYIQLLYTIYYQNLIEEQLELAKNLANAVKSRTDAGAGNQMDLLKSELQLASSQNEIDFAERILHQSRYELFNTMGMDTEKQKYSIQFNDTLRTRNDAIDQEVALEFVTAHPTYMAVLKMQKSAEFNLRESKSNLLPDISFSLYQQDYGDGFDYTGFEVGLHIPLWFPLKQSGEIQQARWEKQALEWKQKEVMLNMKMQIEHAWHNYEASKKSMERFQNIIRSKSEQLKSLTLEAYKLGEIDLLNLLNAQQIYLDTRKNYLNALRDYYLQLIKLEKYMNKEIVY